MTEHRPGWRSGRDAVVVYGLLAAGDTVLSTWQGGLSRDSAGAHWSVALLIGGALLAAVILGRGRQRHTSREWFAGAASAMWNWRSRQRSDVVAVGVWTVLVISFIGWDLVSFIHQSHSFPTLSYYVGHVTRYDAGRGALFALWLGTGAYLVAGWRTGARR